jgi:hypothetical protein
VLEKTKNEVEFDGTTPVKVRQDKDKKDNRIHDLTKTPVQEESNVHGKKNRNGKIFLNADMMDFNESSVDPEIPIYENSNDGTRNFDT